MLTIRDSWSTIGRMSLSNRCVGLLVGAAAVGIPLSRSSAQAAPDSVRIARVVAGLRSSVQVAGRRPRIWSLAERMSQYRAPGVSIAVISGGRVTWARGFGVKEAGGADAVTSETLFQAASISKPVAATGTLRLVAQGRLALDTNVNRYLASWQVPENRFTASEKVTLRRLVSHSAGLTVHGFPGYAQGMPVPSVVQVLNGEKPANTAAVRVDTTPGAIWRYAGGGTTVQQLLLTDVTGEPFPELIRRLVLAPAGMTRSTYEQPLAEARWPEAARAHRGTGMVIPGRWHTYPEMAAAGLWTTPTDLARWALAIAAARAGTDSTLLPPALAAEMLTPQKGSFGLGPSLSGAGRAFRFGHGGANEGFRSNLLYFPEAGVGAAVMVNSDNGDALIQEIFYAIAAEFGWPDYGPRQISAVPRDSAALAAAAGVYDMEFNRQRFPLTVRFEQGALSASLPPSPVAEELVPVDSIAYASLSRGWRYEIRGDSLTVVIEDGPRISGKKR